MAVKKATTTTTNKPPVGARPVTNNGKPKAPSVGVAGLRSQLANIDQSRLQGAFKATSTTGARNDLPPGDGYVLILSPSNLTEMIVESRTAKEQKDKKGAVTREEQDFISFDLHMEIHSVPEGVDEGLRGATFPMNCSTYLSYSKKDVDDQGNPVAQMWGMRFAKQLLELAYGEEFDEDTPVLELIAKLLEDHSGSAWQVNVRERTYTDKDGKEQTKVGYDVVGPAEVDG